MPWLEPRVGVAEGFRDVTPGDGAIDGALVGFRVGSAVSAGIASLGDVVGTNSA